MSGWKTLTWTNHFDGIELVDEFTLCKQGFANRLPTVDMRSVGLHVWQLIEALKQFKERLKRGLCRVAIGQTAKVQLSKKQAEMRADVLVPGRHRLQSLNFAR
jgi:hypothetical protein